MSEKPILYYILPSPPCRAVLLCGAELGIEFDLREVNVLEGETKKDDYLEMNPQGTIPCLDDNGAIIIDSHAICAYLVEKFADSDRLYPKDLVQRALVESRMYFDAGHVFCRLRFMSDFIFMSGKGMDDEKIEYMQRSWDQLNRFVENSPYVCGDEMTIADFCLIATVSSMTEIAPFDSERHAAALEWIDRMSQLPYYDEANGHGAKMIQEFVKGKAEQNTAEE